LSGRWEERRALSERRYVTDRGRFAGDHSGFAEWAARRLELTGGQREVIEIGAGVGRDSKFLVSRGFRVQALEFAPTAVERLLATRQSLSEPFRSRLAVTDAEANEFLGTRPPASADAVYAHLVYGTFSVEESTQLVDAIARVLRPGGVHLFSVRDTSDPLAGQGAEVAEGTYLGGPHELPYRYFTEELCDRLRGRWFERIDLSHQPRLHIIYVADRRISSPPGPPRAASAVSP
jgi:SAM-dependent methyltransferase